MPELMKLLRTKSMMRYLPPKGTAGFARSLVSGYNRVPFPPASTIPNTRSRIGFQPISYQERGPYALIISDGGSGNEMKHLVWGVAMLAWAGLPSNVRLDNARVQVTEVTSAPGAVREKGVRAHDQVIVFLD